MRPGQGGGDEAHPRKEFSEVMLNLGDHASRSVPGSGLVVEAAVADQRRIAGPAARPSEQILDAPFQDLIGRQADRVPHLPPLQRLVEGRERKGRVGANDDGLPLRAVPVNDREEHVVPPVRTVDVARPKLGRETVAARVEDEERVVADGLEVAVVGGP